MLPVYNSHEQLTIGTEEATVVATSSETNSALFAIRLRMHPGGGPPVMHRHDPGEVYYVIEGEFTFYRRRIGRLRRDRHGTGAGHRGSARHRTAWPDPIRR
jgi:quercetin dioxygenase-like cupin family protein